MEPFAPPDEPAKLDVSRGTVVVAWGVAGMALGTCGALLVAAGLPVALMPVLAGLCGGGLIGLVVAQLEGLALQGRPAKMRGTGHAGLWARAVPTGIATGALAVCGLWSGSWIAGAGLGGLSVGLAVLLVPLYVRRALGRAVHAAQRGDAELARAGFLRIAYSSFAMRRQRSVALLNLGRLDLCLGDAEGALEMFSRIDDSRAMPWAATGAALAHLVAGRDQLATDSLPPAEYLPEVRSELDALRIVLCWRREGPVSARRMAEERVANGAGTLSVGLLASLRFETGDHASARALMTPQLLDDLRQGPGYHLPELAGLGRVDQTERPRPENRTGSALSVRD